MKRFLALLFFLVIGPMVTMIPAQERFLGLPVGTNSGGGGGGNGPTGGGGGTITNAPTPVIYTRTLRIGR